MPKVNPHETIQTNQQQTDPLGRQNQHPPTIKHPRPDRNDPLRIHENKLKARTMCLRLQLYLLLLPHPVGLRQGPEQVNSQGDHV